MEFPNIKYSPAWLADKFPGFYSDNEECYFILSDFLRELQNHCCEKKGWEIGTRARRTRSEYGNGHRNKKLWVRVWEWLISWTVRPHHSMCVSSNGKFWGPVYAPSFDLNQCIKVPLDSIGLISVNKVYMSSPPMLDPTLALTLKINTTVQDANTGVWTPVSHDLSVTADSNVLYDVLRIWVDNVINAYVAKQTQAWCLFLKYMLQGLNSVTSLIFFVQHSDW